MSTDVTEIRSWSDEPAEGRDPDEWPYPNAYIESVATGELAARIRARFGVTDGTPVTLLETTISGGYSEYTQENDYSVQVTCGSHVWESAPDYWSNGLEQILAWLDEKES